MHYNVKNKYYEDGWMDDLQFKVLFNSISVISGRYLGDFERLCAFEPRLRLERFPPFKVVIITNLGQRQKSA